MKRSLCAVSLLVIGLAGCSQAAESSTEFTGYTGPSAGGASGGASGATSASPAAGAGDDADGGGTSSVGDSGAGNTEIGQAGASPSNGGQPSAGAGGLASTGNGGQSGSTSGAPSGGQSGSASGASNGGHSGSASAGQPGSSGGQPGAGQSGSSSGGASGGTNTNGGSGAVAGALSGSGGSAGGGPLPPITVGPSGGTVLSADGRAALVVPAGALSAQLPITIAPANGSPAGALGLAYEIGPTGTQFSVPAILEIVYDDAAIGSNDPSTLAIATVVAGAWEPIAASGLVPTDHAVVAPLDHLSPYALAAKKPSSPCDCNTNCFIQGCQYQFGTVSSATPALCSCVGRANQDPYDFNWALDDYYGSCAGKPYASGECTPCIKSCLRNHKGYVSFADQSTCDMVWEDVSLLQAGVQCIAACKDPVSFCGASSDPGGGGEGPPAPLSHFHVAFADVNQTIDCTELDVDATDATQGLVGYGYFELGGESQSTGQTFKVKAPLSATRLRDPSLITTYPMATFGSTRWFASNVPDATFVLSLRLVDSQGANWASCGPGDCGLAASDTSYRDTITSITQESTAVGTASFRISGSYVALVTASNATSVATGDWSILVTVPDPGPTDCLQGCADNGSCVSGTSNTACGSEGQVCANCTSAGGVCLNNACAACVPGSSRSQSCNSGCGTQTGTCGASGVWGAWSLCSAGVKCGSVCCGAGLQCVNCSGGPTCLSPPVKCP